jgi:hypothetical protein
MRRREIGPELSIDPPKSACYLSVLPTVVDKNVASSIPADRDHHRFEPEAALTGRVSAEIMSEHEEQNKGFKVTDRDRSPGGRSIVQQEEERELVEVRRRRHPTPSTESAGRLEPLFLDL